MPGPATAIVTPQGISDGEPGALAALVERRGNSVLAYAEALCTPTDAVRAAAEAFARFRAAVAGVEDPRSLDPETLLLGATRHAAVALARTAPPPPPATGLRRAVAGRTSGASETCRHVPALLAARAQGELGETDHERLDRHLERHAACREIRAAFERAEVAYRRPPERTVPVGALMDILVAMTAAAPVVADLGDDLVFGRVGDDEPTTFVPKPVVAAEPEVAPAPEVAAEPLPRNFVQEEVLPHADVVTPAVAPEPEVAQEPEYERTAEFEHEPDGAPVVGGGVALPRSRRSLHLPSADDHGVLYRYVLPGVALLVAVVLSMVVAGVFSGEDARPAATPTTTAGLAAPPADAPAVVPGETETAAERAAQARERRAVARRTAARRARARRAAAAREAAAARTTDAGAAETTPPATTAPAAAAPRDTTPRRSTGTGSTARDTGEDTASLPGETETSADDAPPVFTPDPAPTP